MKPSPRFRKLASPAHHAQRGYVLITLILFVALLAIGLTALAPLMIQQVKRDREEELIHRGTQYSRSIKHFMKKFSRYPARIEELENTNNIHFLRRRYKDPVTGKDFKLLHMGDVQMATGPGLAGAASAASLAAGSAGSNGGNSSPFGGSGVFGGGPTGNTGSAFGGNTGSAFGGNTGGAFGGNTGGAFGGNTGGAFGGNTPNPPAGGIAGQNNNPDTGFDADANPPAGSPGATGGQSGFGQSLQKLPGFNQQGSGSQGGGNQVFGGGPIVGVVSVSKDKTIRIFSKKEHYNEWQFIYDPTTDRGGLITTPNQPLVQTGAGNLSGTSGGTATPGGSASPFGSGVGPQNPPGGMTPTPQQSPYPQMPPEQSPQ
jgi:type II secretory pathway pseudopilin PulG